MGGREGDDNFFLCSQAEEANHAVWCDDSLHPLHLLCHPVPETGLCAGPGVFPPVLSPPPHDTGN